MTLGIIEKAKRNSVVARRRLDGSLVAVQQRLRPANLAGEAWDGVREKSADLADEALVAVRKRPAAVAAAIGALTLFLAREPIKRQISRMLTRDEADDGRVVTRIETDDPRFTASAPIVDASVSEGVD